MVQLSEEEYEGLKLLAESLSGSYSQILRLGLKRLIEEQNATAN